MSTRTYELTVPVRKGERGMGIVVNPENCVIELAADGPAMADGLTEVEATEPPSSYKAASTTPVVAAAIRAAELAARQSQKEVEAAALEQANRDWEGGRK